MPFVLALLLIVTVLMAGAAMTLGGAIALAESVAWPMPEVVAEGTVRTIALAVGVCGLLLFVLATCTLLAMLAPAA